MPHRLVQMGLAGLWLIDGLLQLQPAMFTGRFAREVIAPVGSGQPAFVARPVVLATEIVLAAPALLNGLFAIVQLAIAAGILYRRTTAVALAVSAVWAGTVWLVGEGLGGVAGGHATLLTGAPGAALIYLALSVALLAGPRNGYAITRLAWSALWLGGAVLQLIAGSGAAREAVAANAHEAPAWLAAFDRASLEALPAHGPLQALSVTAFVALGTSAWGPPTARRMAALSGAALALGFWMLGESLGDYWTGLATDPNSGPAIVLLAVALVPRDARAAPLGSPAPAPDLRSRPYGAPA